MGNKQILAQNNETLASILSNVLGLPTQESLKHGAYVWKKYEYTPEETISQATLRIKSILSERKIHIYDTNFDLIRVARLSNSERDAFFNSFSPNGSTLDKPYISYDDYDYLGVRIGASFYEVTELVAISSNEGYFSTPSTIGSDTITDTTLLSIGSKTLPATRETFVDYVVSDNPTAYPDGGEQGGYWYEKVVEEQKNVACGEITLASRSTSLEIPHGLQISPTHLFVMHTTTLSDSLTGVAIMPTSCTNNKAHVYRGTDMDSTVYHNSLAVTHANGKTTIPSYDSSYEWGSGTYKWMAMY